MGAISLHGLRGAGLFRCAKLELVIAVVDDDHGAAEERAGGFGAGVDGHRVSMHVGVAAHHFCSPGEN